MNITGIGMTGIAGTGVNGVAPELAAERAKLASAARAINDNNIFGVNNELTFAIDPSTQQMVFKVVDRTTHELVMQLPPEGVLRMAANLHSAAPPTVDQYTRSSQSG